MIEPAGHEFLADGHARKEIGQIGGQSGHGFFLTMDFEQVQEDEEVPLGPSLFTSFQEQLGEDLG